MKHSPLLTTAQYIKEVTDKLADLTDEISEIITDEDTLLLENEGRLKIIKSVGIPDLYAHLARIQTINTGGWPDKGL